MDKKGHIVRDRSGDLFTPAATLIELRNNIDHGSLAEIVYKTIREAIQIGLFKGEDILRENEIAEQLNVSRTPVREALRRLKTEGLIIETIEGLSVRRFSVQQVIDIYEIRIALEGISARLASERATYGEIVELKQLHKQMYNQVVEGDIIKLIETNRNFHLKIAQISGCEHLRKFLDLLFDAVHRSYDTTLTDSIRSENTISEHEAIINAIESHDVNGSETTARNHMKNALKERLMIFEKMDLI